MSNSNDLAFPVENYNGTDERGLTKREYAAIKIMAGFAADDSWTGTDIRIQARHAVELADALFAALTDEVTP